MSIRTRIFGRGADEPLLRAKAPRGAKAEMLDTVLVPRAESRRGNARGGDRHRLTAEQAVLRHCGQEHVVELVNLSGGGAMIRGALDLKLWDSVALVLGGDDALDCAVRWLKADRAGLEFAHETRIECDPATRNDLLRSVISKSFPDVEIALDPPPSAANADVEESKQPRADRHPLVWSGMIYYDEQHDCAAEPVRLRNISATGALVQSGNPLEEGMAVHLDMRATGRHEAVVKWTRGDQSGLEFRKPFDIRLLADSAPQITAENSGPSREFGTQEPWAPGWRRSSIGELARDLRG